MKAGLRERENIPAVLRQTKTLHEISRWSRSSARLPEIDIAAGSAVVVEQLKLDILVAR